MRKRASLIAATVVGTLLMGGIGQAGPPDPHPGATQPTREQNVDDAGFVKVHEQGIADTNITNENLDVTLQNEELDVNVTNPALAVEGEVSVSNFPPDVAVNNLPSVQDVRLVGGVLPTITKFDNFDLTIPAGETHTVPVNHIDVVSLSIEDSFDDEAIVTLLTLSNGGGQFTFQDYAGDVEQHIEHFTYPFPVDQIMVFCTNEAEACHLRFDLAGF